MISKCRGGGRSITPPEIPDHILSTDELLSKIIKYVEWDLSKWPYSTLYLGAYSSL